MIESESGVAKVLFSAVFVIGTAPYWASCLVTMNGSNAAGDEQEDTRRSTNEWNLGRIRRPMRKLTMRLPHSGAYQYLHWIISTLFSKCPIHTQ